VSNRRHDAWANYPSRKGQRGPNGRPLCRRCGAEVPKGRRSWCGEQCVHDHRVENDSGYARNRVEERDKGVCSECGLDCERLRRSLRQHNCAGQKRFVHLFLFVTGRPYTAKFSQWRSLWEMDHIKPVVEGGGTCGLENLRTLCVWCHNRVTADLRRRLAKKKNPQLDLIADAEVTG